MIQTDSLRHSRHSVYRISRRSGSNFYRSFHLLPPHKRSAMYALYAFARVTDDLGDCDEPTSIRGRWLDWWRQATALNLIGEDELRQVIFPDEFRDEDLADGGRLRTLAVDVLPAVRDAAIEFSIPSRYLLEIVDGVLADQQKTRFDTYEQVEHYCYLVASAVGIACMHIWGFQGDLPLAAATDCGVGFQWTNILRDVSEDAARGRIYLPRQHYERHGLSEDDLLQGRSDDRLQCLVRDEVRRAERLFASGWTVWDSLHPDGRPMFSMMWRTYRRLLARIGEDPGGVMKRRIRLTQGDKWSIAGRHFIGPLFRRLPVPPKEVSLANQSR
ncbi:MAG: phytoene/squalene synthase family protein [Planctomycetota bacterium]